jgi:hypothetical protein
MQTVLKADVRPSTALDLPHFLISPRPPRGVTAGRADALRASMEAWPPWPSSGLYLQLPRSTLLCSPPQTPVLTLPPPGPSRSP